MFLLIIIASFLSITKSEQEATLGERYNSRPSDSWPSNEECVQRIYRDCNYPTHFTDEELENVRRFLNYSFTQLADVKPDKPLCPKLHVRQDWKCLTDSQKRRITEIFKELYRNGVIDYLTDIHVRWWPSWHKASDFVPAHRWIVNEFEKYMRDIDPTVALPYWETNTYSSQPERASVWDILGHSGSYATGYCVVDGIYKNMIPCQKRHWSPRGTIYPWTSLEYNAYIIQRSRNIADVFRLGRGQHFQPHLNIGGYEGQYSVPRAPYDSLFYMHHNGFLNNLVFKWQLSRREYLTPLSQNLIWRYNTKTGNLEQASIQNDYLSGVPGVTIRELFWVGFGDLCYIPDNLVKPINRLMRGQSDPIPTAVKRMPKSFVERYLPEFLAGNTSSLNHMFEEVGECNRQCLPIPKPTYFNETENGRRQARAFAYDNYHDEIGIINTGELENFNFWRDINRSGYCSPYVTSY